MNARTRNTFSIVLAGEAALLAACGSRGVEGKYCDSTSTFNAEFKDGKAYIAMGAYTVDGTYKIEGDIIIATGDFLPMLPHTLASPLTRTTRLTPRTTP
jgi:hypothetical protein